MPIKPMMSLPPKEVSRRTRSLVRGFAAAPIFRPISPFQSFIPMKRLPPKAVSLPRGMSPGGTPKKGSPRTMKGVGRAVGLGDLNDSNLQSAANTLFSDVSSNGCQQTADDSVSSFQQAWNDAGMTPQLTVDGLYGANTANALGQVLTQIYNTSQANPSTAGTTSLNVAPAGCVGAGGSGGGGSSLSAVPGGNVDSQLLSIFNFQNPLGWAVLGGAAIIGYAIWSKQGKYALIGQPHKVAAAHRRILGKSSRRVARRRRRKNPIKHKHSQEFLRGYKKGWNDSRRYHPLDPRIKADPKSDWTKGYRHGYDAQMMRMR